MSAMMDANETFLIEGEPLKAKDGSVIKKAGELLTLTGEEACQLYGDPPAPLLGFGVFDSYEDILDQRWGDKTYEIIEMEVNWAEEIGLWLNGIAPIILSVGLVCIFQNSKRLALEFSVLLEFFFCLFFWIQICRRSCRSGRTFGFSSRSLFSTS